MHARPPWRPVRILIVVSLTLAAASATVALGLWGTSWSIPRAPSPSAHYTLEATWDGQAATGGALERPIGIAVAPSGDVFVTDARSRVVRFNAAGDVLGEWGREGDGPGEFRNAVAVAVGRDGAVYVSDYEQDRIQKFTATGEFLLEFGHSGSAPGEFNAPAGLIVDDTGSLYVADFYNHRVQKHQPGGSFEVIGHAGRMGPGALHYPTGVAITPQRELLVADAYNYQLQWFDLDGRPLRRIGYHLFGLWPRPAASDAGFFVPTDVTVGRDGILHVADSGNHRVVMLSAEGAYVTEWQMANAGSNVFSPEHVAASPDGSTVYATDLAGNRVLVLAVTPPS